MHPFGILAIWLLHAVLLQLPSCYCDIFEKDSDSEQVKNDTADYVETMTSLEKKLLLQQTYDVESRPVKDPNTSVKVKFHFAVYHIEEVNELEQTLTVHGYLYLQWRDEFLTWTSKEFNNQNQIDLPIWRIWRPDVNLYNSASGKDDWHVSWRYPARIQSDGRVSFWPPVTFRVTCFFDFSDFPNDEHVCPIVLGSWKYYMEQVEYDWTSTFSRKRLAYRSDKIHVAGWEFVDSWSTRYYWGPYGRSNTTSNSSTMHWVELISFIKLRRHAPYFTALFVLPSLATAVFTVFAMFQQTVEHGLFILLTNLVLQGILTRALVLKLPPASSATPRIVHYYGFNLSMTFLGIVLLLVRLRLIRLKCAAPMKLLFLARFYDKLSFSALDTLHLRSPAQGMQKLKNEDEPENQAIPTQTVLLSNNSEEDWKLIANVLAAAVGLVYFLLYLIMSTCYLS